MKIILLLITVMLLMVGADARYSPGLEIAEGENITLDGGYIVNAKTEGMLPFVTVGQGTGNNYVTDGSSDEDQINAAIESGAGLIFLTSPTYTCDGSINTTNHNVVIAGRSMFSTHIDSTASTAITMWNVGTDNACGLQSLTVHGNGIGNDGTPVAGSVGIDILASNCRLDNVKVIGFYYGITAGDTLIAKSLNTAIYDCYTEICEYGIVINNTADLNFWGGRIGQNGLDTARECGVHIEPGAGKMCDSIHFINTVIANNGGFTTCVNLRGGGWLSFDDCDLETATNSSVRFGGGNPTHVKFENCWISQNVSFESSGRGEYIQFEDCKFHLGSNFTVNGADVDPTILYSYFEDRNNLKFE